MLARQSRSQAQRVPHPLVRLAAMLVRPVEGVDIARARNAQLGVLGDRHAVKGLMKPRDVFEPEAQREGIIRQKIVQRLTHFRLDYERNTAPTQGERESYAKTFAVCA